MYLKSIKLFLYLFFCTSILINGQSFGDDHQSDKITNMVGLYLSPSGKKLLENNLSDILEINGISTRYFYLESFSKSLPETSFDELMGGNEKIISSVNKIKRYLRRYFSGNLRIRDSHQVDINVDGIQLALDVEKLGIFFNPTENFVLNEISGHLEIVINDFELKVDRAKIQDKIHPFLGSLGPESFKFTLKKPLTKKIRITMPFKFNASGNGGGDLYLSEIQTNLAELKFDFNWESFELPRVRVSINGNNAWLNRGRVERELKKRIPSIFEGSLENLIKYSNDVVLPKLNEVINQKLSIPRLELSEMAPTGMPEDKNDPNYIWGMGLEKVARAGSNVYFGLFGLLYDPENTKTNHLDHKFLASSDPDSELLNNAQFDVALTINKGLFNRILQLSSDRGYFKNISAGSERLNLARPPYLKLINSKKGSNKAKLNIVTKYNVTGFQKIFVKNPIEINMDLNVGFVKNQQGIIQMVVEGIDTNSAKVDKRFIRSFYRKVQKAVKKRLKAIGKDIKGFVLSDNLPIPTDIAGVPLQVNDIMVDTNGYLLILLNYDL